MTASRANQIADAWVAVLEAHDWGEGIDLHPERVRTIEDTLPAAVAAKAYVVPRADNGAPASRESWDHAVEILTVLRVRDGADVDLDAWDRIAEALADLAKTQQPLLSIDGYRATLTKTDRVLSLPRELQQHGLLTAAVTHTWHIEVET